MDDDVRIDGGAVLVVGLYVLRVELQLLRVMTVAIVFTVDMPVWKSTIKIHGQTMSDGAFVRIGL